MWLKIWKRWWMHKPASKDQSDTCHRLGRKKETCTYKISSPNSSLVTPSTSPHYRTRQRIAYITVLLRWNRDKWNGNKKQDYHQKRAKLQAACVMSLNANQASNASIDCRKSNFIIRIPLQGGTSRSYKTFQFIDLLNRRIIPAFKLAWWYPQWGKVESKWRNSVFTFKHYISWVKRITRKQHQLPITYYGREIQSKDYKYLVDLFQKKYCNM